jgi:ornithine decarboxylase
MDDLTQVIQDHGVRLFTENESIYDIIECIISDTTHAEDQPFFIIDLAVVAEAYDRFTELLPGVEIFYAAKCNSDPVVLRVLAAKGCKFDVASLGEISAVLDIAGRPENLILAHPIKTCNTLKYARAVDVDLMTFDTSNELLKVKLHHPQAKLVMRLKVNDTGSTSRFSGKFGVDEADVEPLLALAQTLSLEVVGFSFHVGSGCTDPDLYGAAIRRALAALEVAGRYGMKANVVDIGGGFSSSTFEAAAAVIQPLVESRSDLRWLAEPGRLLVNDSSTLVVSVVGKKEAKGTDGTPEQQLYVNDSVYSSFNGLVYDRRTVTPQSFNERDGAVLRSRVFGNTCDGIDEICGECLLPNLAIGEKLFVRNMGAYSSSAASCFNGFERAKLVYILTSPVKP